MQVHAVSPTPSLLPADQKAEDASKIWYFAYGSNMASETFRQHRGITPLAAVPVRIPGWALTFDIYGIPYREPAFSSISPIPFSDSGTGDENEKRDPALPPVHGVAYLLDRRSWYSVVRSEGGGTAYDEVEVLAEALRAHACDENGDLQLLGDEPNQPGRFHVTTLVRGYGPTVPRCPSLRYKNIILDGAREADLPRKYRSYLATLPFYDPPRNGWRRLGAVLFLALWAPIMAAAEKLTGATANWDGKGNCPSWVKKVVRLILLLMWLHHDWLHAPLFGRGDGWDDDDTSELDCC
ncbi:gamma-glutamylcyclotransferase family protein [Aspergillus thermomutatus]|uniref:gamma-glutamylcyclotransferase n=1 Tax=Aspergillus thermomutatus TaxID=41047 RepID=A0A397H0Y5_ASPTH|nr:uncharacterized protein CDV56_102274 [Aspergillus thermomutatus]RHZ55538.1 hypothetical protein CDV56_102274 [Aspergillus thermomutatus]